MQIVHGFRCCKSELACQANTAAFIHQPRRKQCPRRIPGSLRAWGQRWGGHEHRPITSSRICAASSSCSYAAGALSRSIFRKRADCTAAMAFQFASTNLVLELCIILAVLLGWRFTLAEFVSVPIMIGLMASVLRRLMTEPRVAAARAEAERGRSWRMEGHAAMDMSLVAAHSMPEVFDSAPKPPMLGCDKQRGYRASPA